MDVQMKNIVRPLFEKSFQVRVDLSFWITEEIGQTAVVCIFDFKNKFHRVAILRNIGLFFTFK
jgi:hypothetical protein